jgi:hypothetical protein
MAFVIDSKQKNEIQLTASSIMSDSHQPAENCHNQTRVGKQA